jgi:hypothetical protein
MKNKIGLLVGGLMMAAGVGSFAAEATTGLDQIGTLSGTTGLYYVQKVNKNDNVDDYGIADAYLRLKFDSKEFNGLSFGLEGFAAEKIWEDASDDYVSSFERNFLLTQAYLKYNISKTDLTIGRQQLNTGWLGGAYYEGATLSTEDLDNFKILVGFINKKASADNDEIADGFDDQGVEDGTYFGEVTFTGVKDLELTGYYYSATDLADWYGARVDYSANIGVPVNFWAEYAQSSEDTGDDGSILHVRPSVTLGGVTVGVGYVKTDADAGIGSMGTYSDSLNPFDIGDYTYLSDGRTVYVTAASPITEKLSVSALVGKTTYEDNDDEVNEYNLCATYSLASNLDLAVGYTVIDAEDSDDSYDRVKAHVTYNF